MAQIIGTPATESFGSFAGLTHTINVTIPAGTQVLVIGATVSRSNWDELSTLTVGGSATGLEQISTTVPAQANKSARWWIIRNPTPATVAVAWTFFAQGANGGARIAFCCNQVDMASLIAFADQASTATANNGISTAVTSPPGGLALNAYATNVLNATAGATETNLYNDPAAGSGFSYKIDATSMGVVFSGAGQVGQAVMVLRSIDATPPTITVPGDSDPADATATVSVPENTTAVATLSANETVTWAITGGPDAAKFSLTGAALSFLAPPDFETPASAAGTNAYVVQVTATDAATNPKLATITVNVTNAAGTAPAAPTLQAPSLSSGTVLVPWAALAGADTYSARYKFGAGAFSALQTGITTTSIQVPVTTAQLGQTVTVEVTGVNAEAGAGTTATMTFTLSAAAVQNQGGGAWALFFGLS